MSAPSLVTALAAAVAAAFAAAPALAQSWPEKPMRIIVPWAPGGSTDIVGRLLASDLSKRFGQNVVIENRAGAGSIIGLEFASAAAPDGYTWMLTSTGYGFIIQKAKVDLVNSFAPVAIAMQWFIDSVRGGISRRDMMVAAIACALFGRTRLYARGIVRLRATHHTALLAACSPRLLASSRRGRMHECS